MTASTDGGDRRAPDDPNGRPTTTEPEDHWLDTWRLLPKPLRVSAYLCLLLCVALVACVAFGVVLVRRPFPQVDGTIAVPGLGSKVTVVRDSNGIPQLYGANLDDLMQAQGYVAAQERFFQMDVRRHLAAGRLSEMFGSRTLESDKLVRTLGWRRTAAREVAILQPRTRAALQAYADGVNAYLDTHSPSHISVEYSLLAAQGLDYAPAPWTAVDSLSWLEVVAWDLRGNMSEEIERVLDLTDHTRKQVDELFPAYDHAQSPPIAGQPPGLGGNSWVVDGQHSTTGEPILADDPHLGVSLPGMWMQFGLHCTVISPQCPIDVSGFTFAGMPGIVAGHNERIAWGLNSLDPDVSDLYLERLRGDRWLHGGRWVRLEERHETIKVRGQDDVHITVRSTAHGPILSDVSDQLTAVGAQAPLGRGSGRPAAGQDLAVSVAWTGDQPSRTADAILGLDAARDWSAFRRAASRFDLPAQSLVYADTDGHIGYQATGRIPIRRSGDDGRWPSPGWLPHNDWTGRYIPFRELPSVLDPVSGHLVTANQAVIGPSYPRHLTADLDPGYRSDRSGHLIGSRAAWSVADMTAMQLDTANPMAPVLTPYLLHVKLPRGYDSSGQNLLRGWDFTQPAGSGAAAYYNVVWNDVLADTFHDELPADEWPDGGERWMAVMTRLLREPHDAWWDDKTTAVRETRDDILRRAMLQARDDMTRMVSRFPSRWTWGAIHRLDLSDEPLGQTGIGPVRWLLDRNGFEVGGGDGMVDATSWNARSGYDVTAAPSMRMVVSLANLDDSRWISLTGESGHAFDRHYIDQTRLWVKGQTLPWAFSRGAVARTTQHTLTFIPG